MQLLEAKPRACEPRCALPRQPSCATRVFTTYIHTNKRYKGEHRPVHCTGIETVRRSEDRRAERSSQAATAHGADRGAHLKTR